MDSFQPLGLETPELRTFHLHPSAALPGASASEDSLAEFSRVSRASEDLCRWKLEAMSWDAGEGLKPSGILSRLMPPLKESIAREMGLQELLRRGGHTLILGLGGVLMARKESRLSPVGGGSKVSRSTGLSSSRICGDGAARIASSALSPPPPVPSKEPGGEVESFQLSNRSNLTRGAQTLEVEEELLLLPSPPPPL